MRKTSNLRMVADMSRVLRSCFVFLRLIAVSLVATAGTSPVMPPFQRPEMVPATLSRIVMRGPFSAVVTSGAHAVAAGRRGQIVYSDDQTTWIQAQVPVSSDLTAMFFPSSKVGWAVGHEGVILHTNDGGATWTRQLDSARLDEIIAAARKKAGSTSDAPQMEHQNADSSFLDVWFRDERTGFAIGAFNLIVHTDDGGRTWQPWMDRVENPKNLHLYAIRPAQAGVYIVGEQGLLLRLDESARRFVRISIPYEGTLFGVLGTSEMSLVFGLRGNVFRSTDDARTWDKVPLGIAGEVTAGVVREGGTVILASQGGQLLVSHDRGGSFEMVRRAANFPLFSIATLGGDRVLLAGPTGIHIEAVK